MRVIALNKKFKSGSYEKMIKLKLGHTTLHEKDWLWNQKIF